MYIVFVLSIIVSSDVDVCNIFCWPAYESGGQIPGLSLVARHAR